MKATEQSVGVKETDMRRGGVPATFHPSIVVWLIIGFPQRFLAESMTFWVCLGSKSRMTLKMTRAPGFVS